MNHSFTHSLDLISLLVQPKRQKTIKRRASVRDPGKFREFKLSDFIFRNEQIQLQISINGFN
jgi:hypothetical protein